MSSTSSSSSCRSPWAARCGGSAAWLLWAALVIVLLPLPHCPCVASQSTSLGVHIVRSPESAVAPKGDEVVFECELNLAPERLQWRFRKSNSRGSNANQFKYLKLVDGYNVTNDERTSKLHIFVSVETLGDYQCVAWFGSAAIASMSARLTLVSIGIDNSNGYSNSGRRYTVAPKNVVLIRCGTVSSNPPAVWSFYRNGEKIPQTEVLSSSGALILHTVTAKDSGNYTCSAMNAITGVEVRLPQRIDLRIDYTDRTAPHFLDERSVPNQVTVRAGETLVLECPGVGSPPPAAVWSSPNVASINYNNRTKLLSHGLQISDVLPEDEGSYICRLDNGIAPAKVFIIKLNVLERPQILRGPATTLTNEGDSLELECSATGNPFPDIYWLINGEDSSADNETFHEDRRLVIKHVQKRHAGIVQCFAKNVVAETSEGSLLRVNPRQIQGESGGTTWGNVPTRSAYDHFNGSKGKGKRKHTKLPNMIPPSRPNVTRLNDHEVMLRWYVPKNVGLPIEFFKVQYRMLGTCDNSRGVPRETWQTTNEEIPYGSGNGHSHDKNFTASDKNYTSSVTGLRPDRHYRFRIIAVYTNHDNKEGNTSAKFCLKSGADLGEFTPLPVPVLDSVEAVSKTTLRLHWTLPAMPYNFVDGFYAYYRLASSAGDYLKATVDGMHTRTFDVDMLEPGNSYEFKLQSFNELAASEFSKILQGRTMNNVATPVPNLKPAKTEVDDENNSIYPVVAGAAGGGILLLLAIIAACLCVKRCKHPQPEDEDKPQLDHIQAEFAMASELGVSPHHKSGHRLNGVIPRMNITPNPLAQEADKNRNVMELRFMVNNTTAAQSPAGGVGEEQLDDEVDDQHGEPQQPRRSSSSLETLEASEGVTTATTTTTTTSALPNGNAASPQPDPNSPLSKPLPPLPTKAAAAAKNHTTPPKATTANHSTQQQQQQAHSNHTHNHHNHPQYHPKQPQQQQHSPPPPSSAADAAAASANSPAFNSNNSHNSQALSQMGLHHAQPYHHNHNHGGLSHGHNNHSGKQQHHHLHQTPPPMGAPGTPTMLHKRDYPPPVPPHQNNNHQAHHTLGYQQPPSPLTSASMEQHRRTLERSARNLHYPPSQAPHSDAAMNIDGLPATRIPSLRRTRRTSGNANNNNGGVGIPIVVPGSPRVQRSPMPARAMIKRNRLGSHNDNISSGSLNSIEV